MLDFPVGHSLNQTAKRLSSKEEKSWWHLTVMETHTISSIKKAIRNGFLDPSAPPAATVHTGDVVGFPNTWTQRGNGMSFAEREPLRHQCPHGPKRLP